MNPLEAARKHVADALEDAGIPTFHQAPEAVKAGCAIVSARDPWMEADGYCAHTVRHSVTLVGTSAGSNRAAVESVEALAWRAWEALSAHPRTTPESLQAPGLQVFGTAELVAAELEVLTTVQ